MAILLTPRRLFLRCFPSLGDFAFLAPAILLFAVMSGTADLLGDGDVVGHRAGDWILDDHRLPTTHFFLFTQIGQPSFAWEWLWEASFSLLHRLAGMPGVILASVVGLASRPCSCSGSSAATRATT